MPDIGWMELLVIGIVALIVVGPKDLPIMFRKAGQMTGRIRAMAKEFSNAMNEAADESGMKDLNRDLRKMANPKKYGMDALNKSVRETFDDIDPSKFEEGSETRKMAEKKADAAREAREAAAARKAQEDEKIRAAKIAAAEAADAAETAPEPELPPEPAPAPAAAGAPTGTEKP